MNANTLTPRQSIRRRQYLADMRSCALNARVIIHSDSGLDFETRVECAAAALRNAVSYRNMAQGVGK